MKKLLVSIIMIAAAAVALSAHHEKAVIPAKITKHDQSGAIFEREDMIETKHDSGNVTLDVRTLLSSDKKFASGMYRAGKSYWEAKDAYGVDEFMYFLEGGVKLTSSDGTVQTINAGEAVTIPKEWTGIWETDGYTKIWVIYSADVSGL
jgi:uncharacterized cupin superfamily protein